MLSTIFYVTVLIHIEFISNYLIMEQMFHSLLSQYVKLCNLIYVVVHVIWDTDDIV